MSPSPLCPLFPIADLGPHSQRRLAQVPIATLPRVPGAPLSPGRPSPPSHLLRTRPRLRVAPLIARRVLTRRMFPTLQRFTFPAPLSPTFPTSPHPAHVPSARLPHVPVDTSRNVRGDALPNSVRPIQPAAEPERSEGASSCSDNPMPLNTPPPLIITSEPNAGIADELRCAGWPKPLSSIRRLSAGRLIRCRRRC